MPFVADSNTQAVTFVPDGGAGFVPDSGSFVADTPPIPQFRAYEEPGLVSRALTAGREFLSPLVGLTENQRLAQETDRIALARQFPQIADQAAKTASSAQTEGVVPALFTPSPLLPQLPQIQGESTLGQVGAGIYNPFASAVNSAVASPGGLLTLPLSTALQGVPALGKLVAGAFAADMGRQVIENAPNAYRTITDPNATTQQKVEAGVGEALTAGLSALGARHAIAEAKTLPPQQATIRLREEAAVTADAQTAKALESLASDIEKQMDAQNKAQAEAVKTQQAQADAMAAQQQPPPVPEIPKSAQILAEPTANPPSIANVATEVATQTKNSPFALQERLNQMTAVEPPSPAPQIEEATKPAVGQGPVIGSELDQFNQKVRAENAEETKADAVKTAVAAPDTQWQYTVQRPMYEGGKGFIQVDAINGDRNTVSSNLADLNAAGAKLPDVPDWVPQGQYSLEQIKDFVKQGEPKAPVTGEPTNAIPIQATGEVGLRNEAALREKVGGDDQPAVPPPANPADQAGDQVREGPLPEPLSEARQIAASAAPFEPASGRPASATQKAATLRAQRAGLISGSAAEQWADTTLGRIRKEGRQYSGFDAEYGTAATIKLLADLERGVVDFAKWSAEQVKLYGAEIQPRLKAIWDQANEQFNRPPDVPVYGRENMGPNSARTYDRDIPTITNEQQAKYAKQLGDYAARTGNWTLAYEHLQNGVPSEYRAPAAAELAIRAESIADPVAREAAVRRFALTALDTTSQAGQALQSAIATNKVLGPLSGYMSYLGLIRRRLGDIPVPDGVVDRVNRIFMEAGDEAGRTAGDATEGKPPVKIGDVDAVLGESTPVPKADPALGEKIMAIVRQSAGYREFFTKKGVDGIARRFADVLKAKAPEGNVWTFDSIVTSELGSILSEQMKAAGLEKPKGKSITTPERIAQFLSSDSLRGDKVKLIDQAVRNAIAARPEAEQQVLLQAWDASVGALSESASSIATARSIIHETIKELAIKPADLAKSRQAVLEAIEKKVRGAGPGADKLNLTQFSDATGKVYDEIVAVRQAAMEKNRKLAEARAKAAASPEAEANRIVNQFAKIQSDTQAWADATKKPVAKLTSDYIKGIIDRDAFLSATDALGIKRATSETLESVIAVEKNRRALWSDITAHEKIVENLGKHDAMLAPLRRIAKQTGVVWTDLLSDLPENQATRKAELLKRLGEDQKLSSLPDQTKVKLADAAERAWSSIRDDVFRREFGKVVGLPDIPIPEKARLEASLPNIIKQANLGLLDNDAFRSALANQYGLEGMDSATGKKLRELGQEAARTPEGVERNAVYQEMHDTLMEAKGVNPWDFLKDFWYRNVMSAPRTAFEIGVGGVVNGVARTYLTAVDTALAQKKPWLALQLTGEFLKDAFNGARLGADLVATGDRTVLPRYNAKFLEMMDRLDNGKSPGGEIESMYRRGGTGTKIALAPFEFVGRALTALDYIGGQGVRQQQMAYAALTRGDKVSFDAAMKRFDKAQVVRATAQARAELGPQARAAKVIARTRELMNEGISKEIQDFGNDMTEVVALNAKPVGLGGVVYGALSKLPMLVRAPTGLAFVKAGINLFQESTNWAPVTGQINAARALWRDPSPSNPLRWLALDKLPPERGRQIVAAQATGLALMLAAANKFLTPQPEDKDGKPRKWEITGGWNGLTPQQKSTLMSSGEKPYAIKLPSGRWVDYKMTPFIAALATIGHMRDQERFGGKKWTDEGAVGRAVTAWLMGLGSIKDLSVSSQAAQLAGLLANDSRELDEKTIVKRIADSVGNAAMGLVPMDSLLRELDNYGDQQRYRPNRGNPGVDLWLQQVPYARRTVGPGPMLDFLGQPVKVSVTPINRHVGDLPPADPVTRALSDKVSVGMKLPVLSDNSTIVALEKGKPVARPMTGDEAYAYQKAVRQGFARQLTNDLPAFVNATPEQAALYSQAVFTAAEKYVRDRLNTGAPFDGVVPVDPKLSPALTPEYQDVKAANSEEGTLSALDRSRLRVAYDGLKALPQDQRMAALRDTFAKDPAFGIKLAKYAASPVTERDVLEKAVGGLEADSRAEHFKAEFAKLPTPEARRSYLRDQVKAGLITREVLQEMAKHP